MLITAASAIGKYLDEDCPRVRQAMHKMTTEELLLYADGMHRIRKNGKYQIMVNAHQMHKETHRGSAFFFYHTYFVWEVETQIRALGGKFKCFALPMYDWTIDVGREQNPWILNTVLGGDGDPNNLLCVAQPNDADSAWSQPEWNVRELCNKNLENSHIGCCLKRQLWDEGDLGDAVTMGEVMERDTFKPMSGGVAFYHQKVHWLFGRGDECQNCAMATGYSPDDPIFMVLHSFAAYLRAIWASCHGYDNIPMDELEDYPEAYLPGCADADIDLADGSVFSGDCGVVMYDDVFEFEEMAEQSWSITSQIGVTPRMMWNFADWNVKFNHGTFYEKSGLSTSTQCDQANVAASEWFSDVGPMLGSANAAFDLWMKDMPPPLKKEEEVEEQGSDFGGLGDGENFMPEGRSNPYGAFQRNEEADASASEGTSTSQKSRFASLRAYDGHTRGEDMTPGDGSVEMDTVDTVDTVDAELVHIKGEVGGTVVKDHNNYLMLTCIILLLLGIGLALYAYNNRTSKFVLESMHTLRTDAYGAV